MLFPPFLVSLFFLTLNFNHKTLYAPSDFENQENFMKLFTPATYTEWSRKLTGEIIEADTGPEAHSEAPQAMAQSTKEASQKLASTEPQEMDNRKESVDRVAEDPIKYSLKKENGKTDSQRNPTAEELAKGFIQEEFHKLREIESLAVRKLAQRTRLSFSENVKFELPGQSPLVFDAVSGHQDLIHIAEVKYFSLKPFSTRRFLETVTAARIVENSIGGQSGRSVLLHLIVVTEKNYSDIRRKEIALELMTLAMNFSLKAKVYITTPEALSAPDRILKETQC